VRKLLIRLACVAITFGLGLTLHQFKSAQNIKLSPVNVNTPQTQLKSPEHQPIDDRFTLADLLTSEQNVALFNGYLIEKRYRNGDDSFFGIQEYVAISKNGMKPLIFDAKIDHPQGNTADFEWVSLLGSSAHQLAISQEVGRGGAQWIVDLSAEPRVIFDGEAWRVGREADDCEIEDLDGDGVFEIIVPITDFYSFMDKMAVSNVPLPRITFKYDPHKRRYFPASHTLGLDQPKPRDIPRDGNDFYFRSRVLDQMLELIYKGKRQQAWQYFNTTYNLNDKKEFERRVKDILRDQPIYKYIYKNKQTH
jgi:hypothetical protein